MPSASDQVIGRVSHLCHVSYLNHLVACGKINQVMRLALLKCGGSVEDGLQAKTLHIAFGFPWRPSSWQLLWARPE